MSRHTKWVNCFQLQPNQKITGHKNSSSTSYFSATVVSVNENSIDILKWGETPETISNKGLFEVEMPQKEFREKYKEEAKQVIIAVQNEMYIDETGYHEMYNAWIDYDPYEMAFNLKENNATLLGYFRLSYPKTSWGGTSLDIGLVVEEEGDRYWCHVSSEYIKEMVDEYEELNNESNN